MVDHVIIINHGRLVVEAPLDELTERSGGAIRVETTRSDALELALRDAGVTGIRRENGTLYVRGITADRIGKNRVGGARRVEPTRHRVLPLEDIFLDYRGAGAMTGQLYSELLKVRTTRTARRDTARRCRADAARRRIEGLSRLSATSVRTTSSGDASVRGKRSRAFSTIAGLTMVTSEFRYGTIHPTLLFEPRRRVVSREARRRGLDRAAVWRGLRGLSVGIGRAILRHASSRRTLELRPTVVLG